MLREAINTIYVEGILSEIDIVEKSFMKDGKTTDAIVGTIKILVEREDKDKSETEINEIPFNLFATKYTKAGGLNPAFESILNVKNNFVSIAACGSKEDADKVRISKGRILMNPFYANDGRLVNQLRLSTSFISKITKDFDPKATFEIECFVSHIDPVVDRDGVEISPRKLNVTAIVPMYGGSVQEVPLVTINENVTAAIERYWEVGKTYKCNGRLHFSSTTQDVIEEVDFGEPIKKKKTISVHELAITGGSNAPIDDEYAFALEDIKEAMAARKARLEEQKNTPKKTAPAPAAKTTINKGMDLGF